MKFLASPLHILALACLFLSGMAGLVYQVVWNRYLALFLGHSSYATIAVLCSFMGGLALGNKVFGGWADRQRRPLLAYAWLEAGIAIYAFVFPSYYHVIEAAYLPLAKSVGSSGFLGMSVRMVFGIAMLLLPTMLMGGTIPLLTKLVSRKSGDVGQKVASLYAFNSLGAAVGCWVSDFWWIPSIGLEATVLFAGATNAVVAVACFYGSRFETNRVRNDTQSTAAEPNKPLVGVDQATQDQDSLRLALYGVAVSGFAAMLYEVAWTRILALSFGSSTHAFSIMLITFIGGIALGSWIIAAWQPKTDVLVTFARCEVLLAGILTISLFQYEAIPYWFAKLAGLMQRSNETYGLYQVIQAVLCVGVMALPATCLGMTLPLASQAATREFAKAGQAVGTVFAYNTVGTVLGAALTGLWLLPALGLAKLLGLGIALNASVGAAILARGWLKQKPSRWFSIPIGVVGLTLVIGSLFESGWQHGFVLGLFRQGPPQSFAEFQKDAASYDLRYYKDGATATVSVQRSIVANQETFILRVNGKVDASNGTDVTTQLLLAHIPMLLHPKAESAMIIGLGSGMTCGAALTHPSLTHLDVVEISPEVAEAAKWFSAHSGNALSDARLKLHIEDAKTFMRLTDRQYDVLISEPSNPWMAGVAGVFSKEHFEQCRASLKPGGIMAQWVHTYEISDNALKTIFATFYSVFPNGSVWYTALGDLVLLGAMSPILPETDGLQQRIASVKVAKDLARIDLHKLPAFLAREIISNENTPFLVEDGVALESDFFPSLEYITQKDFFLRLGSSLPFALDENHSPRATTLLAKYARSKGLTDLDLRSIILFFNSFKLPEPRLARSVIHQWLSISPTDRLPVEFLASIRNPNASDELAALTLDRYKEKVLASTEKDSELLKWYGLTLLHAHRSKRSALHLPDSTELEKIIEKLIEIDPANARTHWLHLAELAWDRGDDDRCLQLGTIGFDPSNPKLGPLKFAGDPLQPARAIHFLLEASLLKRDYKSVENWLKEGILRQYVGPQANPTFVPAELSVRKALSHLADYERTKTPPSTIPTTTNP